MHITEVVLHSADLDAQAEFYREVLRLPVTTTAQQVTVTAGRSRLILQQVDKKSPYVYHLAFNIPENQLPAASAWLSLRTPILANLNNPASKVFDFINWNAHAFYFKDAEGNILEFIARHNLPNTSDTPFTADDILGISEVGLPTPDVPGTVRILHKELGLPIWRGAESESFTAVGDEEGLLIVVKNNRTWMPTADQDATPLPLTLTIAGLPVERYAFESLPYVLRRG